MSRHNLMPQFTRFLGVGAFATGVQYLILVLLVQGFQVDAVTASSIGFAIAAVVNYALNRSYTFESNARHRVAAFKFFLIAGIGLGFNSAVVALGTKVLGIHYLPVQVVATGVVLVWNFVMHRIWTFNEHPVGA